MHRPIEIVLPTVLLGGVLSSFSAATQLRWSDKDWHHWTDKECREILRVSPWAKTGGPERDDPPSERVSYTIQLISALPIRQALARQWQIENNYDQLSPEQRQAADQRIDTEIGESYEDRIVVRVIIELVDVRNPTPQQLFKATPLWPVLIFPHGNTLSPRHMTTPQMNSHGQGVFDTTFQRLRGGRPLIEEHDKKLTIQLMHGEILIYEFDLRKMVYGGKLEY